MKCNLCGRYVTEFGEKVENSIRHKQNIKNCEQSSHQSAHLAKSNNSSSQRTRKTNNTRFCDAYNISISKPDTTQGDTKLHKKRSTGTNKKIHLLYHGN